MCFAHRAQGIPMTGSTKSQDTWSVVIETHGESLHLGALQEARDLDLGETGALPVRGTTKAQNTFEMTGQRQGLIHLGDFSDMEETASLATETWDKLVTFAADLKKTVYRYLSSIRQRSSPDNVIWHGNPCCLFTTFYICIHLPPSSS